jgi:hypothetical protein
VGLSPGLKQQGCRADHSPPSSAKLKNGGVIHSPPPTCTHSMMINELSPGITNENV